MRVNKDLRLHCTYLDLLKLDFYNVLAFLCLESLTAIVSSSCNTSLIIVDNDYGMLGLGSLQLPLSPP